ncbi:hypothetical protein D3C72_1549650 [compost metagenome]
MLALGKRRFFLGPIPGLLQCAGVLGGIRWLIGTDDGDLAGHALFVAVINGVVAQRQQDGVATRHQLDLTQALGQRGAQGLAIQLRGLGVKCFKRPHIGGHAGAGIGWSHERAQQ